MTDNEIIKALECCKKRTVFESCPVECPMYKFDGDCFDLMQTDILDLINRQKAEIERLTEENQKVSAYIGNGWGYVSFLEFVKNQRAEAIKEFAERLKQEVYTERGFSVFPDDKIDNLVKEMVGDTE